MLPKQVQAAVQEASPGAGAAAGGGGMGMLRRSQPAQPVVLAEGAEVSLLYVRFRAAAEPSLKGAQWLHAVCSAWCKRCTARYSSAQGCTSLGCT